MTTIIPCSALRSRCNMGPLTAGLMTMGLVLGSVPKGLAAEALTVRVAGLSEPSGHVMISLYDGAEAFEAGDDEALQRERLPVGGDLDVVWNVKGLAPGDYGVALFHDVDDDEVLDTNFVGVPKEPYGFSNDARGRFGPPDYDAITFAFDGSSLAITINAK